MNGRSEGAEMAQIAAWRTAERAEAYLSVR